MFFSSKSARPAAVDQVGLDEWEINSEEQGIDGTGFSWDCAEGSRQIEQVFLER